MIKADPNVVRFRRLHILYLACVIVMIAVTAFIYLTSTTSTTFRIWSLIVPFFVLFSFFSFIQQGQYWKRFEQRRIRAAQGDQSLLSEEQPALDEAAFSLPLTIQSRNSSPENFFLAMIGVVVITIIIVGFIGFLAGSTSIFSPSDDRFGITTGIANGIVLHRGTYPLQ